MTVILTKKSLLISKTNFQLFSFFLSLVFFPFSSSIAQCDDNYVKIGSYHVEFVGVEYDFPQEGQSTWFYTFYATSGKDISHVTIPLSKNCIDVLDAGTWGDDITDLNSGQGKPEIGKDPKAKIPFGMKFDEGIDKGDSENYYFTLDKNLAVEPVAKISIKAGKPFHTGTVCGPSPECNEDFGKPLESCISGLAFHDKNRNGSRDADEAMIGNVTVKLRKSNGSLVNQMPTSADGTYSFCELEPGSYFIQMEASFEYFVTQTNTGSDDLDNDLESMGYTGILDIEVLGDSHVNVDGGYFKFGDFDNQAYTAIGEKGYTVTKENNQGTTAITTSNEINTINPPIVFDDQNSNSSNTNINVKVFPNPVVNRVTFEVDNIEINGVTIEIRNQANQLILTTAIPPNSTQKSLSFSNLPNGIYFASFIFDDEVKVKKIIKE